MKILLISLALLLSVSTFAFSAPFLVCDPQTGVETYTVIQEGEEIATDVSAESDGSLRYDLVNVTPGVYNFTAKACEGDWGCSEVSDPYISNTPMNKPTGLEMDR